MLPYKNFQNISKTNLIELNVGGVFYSTSINTLTSESGSKLANIFGSDAKDNSILKDTKVPLL